MLGLIFTLILHVSAGGSINEALEQARTAYATTGETTTIMIEPGDYEEELTIDVPGLRLINAAQTPGIGVRNGGVEIDSNAVRISWYYGHGYQYASMKGVFNYGGKRARRWNASVLVTAPRFYAENIIFQNSFNLYVSAREALDTLVDISQAKNDWTANERPKRIMPDRPKEAGNTDVQTRFYRERASALSFTAEAKDCVLKNCRVVGRQDAFYGDHGASVAVEGGILADVVCGGRGTGGYDQRREQRRLLYHCRTSRDAGEPGYPTPGKPRQCTSGRDSGERDAIGGLHGKTCHAGRAQEPRHAPYFPGTTLEMVGRDGVCGCTGRAGGTGRETVVAGADERTSRTFCEGN